MIYKRVGTCPTNQTSAKFEMNLREDWTSYFHKWLKDAPKSPKSDSSGQVIHKKEFSSIPSRKLFLKNEYGAFLPPVTESGKQNFNKMPFHKEEKELTVKAE